MVWTPSIVLVALPWWLLTHQIAATSNELPCADDENCDSGLPQPAHALLGVSAKHGRTILDADDFQNSPPKKHALYKDHHEKCIFRATADCTTTGEPEVWREQQCHEYLPGCKGSSGWCDCNGNKIKEDWEVGFNCTGPNNYTSLLKEFGEILLKYKNTSYGSELKIAYGNFPECNYTEEELTGHGGHWTACLNITCLPFCHPKTTTTTSTTITTTITTTSTSTATTTTTTTSTSTTTSTTSTTSTSTSTSSTTTTSTSTSTTTTTTTSTSTSTTTTTTTIVLMTRVGRTRMGTAVQTMPTLSIMGPGPKIKLALITRVPQRCIAAKLATPVSRQRTIAQTACVSPHSRKSMAAVNNVQIGANIAKERRHHGSGLNAL
mmetsp:Transcript_114461/g.227809  ORF Transcript_114461/g.227809 Transcript_114461/m.227809 type:complete len:378 (-) Transcript_114461:552-1685(-)